ncbi:hypothetical protein [Alicyclobacillus acidocaldarius]|uniref:Uncharacterized protein n=1 Tax=Alicyclobacillus acidocaldarius subsp. acidocaldarius (strain ATCC 27009 / DSM 446 / BCRC 14685 / JCM 5260 / KCTC 1825 / NBRC 15652 / NCIMB 11725 / NRRL B-14509 / 104-IA) TaxID=521098 RepID=C8WVZ8_ALIAD|nr:hypothetical protein [Alicyclobacillus acidocaldarius]ACV58270.1 hypothetical protein Aaci_1241 [Alicyclobacillus acidocaldarius subsp. acidocaldarius DSM 446]
MNKVISSASWVMALSALLAGCGSSSGGGPSGAASVQHSALSSTAQPAPASISKSAQAGDTAQAATAASESQPAQTGAAQVSPTPAVGWYAVPIGQAYGDLAVIAGVEPEGARLRITVRVEVRNHEGWIMSHRWAAAWFTPATGRLQPAGSLPAQTQRTYAGPVHLEFSSGFPSGFVSVPVTVEVGGKPAAKWPSSIPTYGSLVNPETFPPGSWDNVILGQVGNWIWVALKGPKDPPFSPHAWPITWGFRTWDRLVAFDVVTGQAVEYAIPRSYGYGSWVDMVTPNAVLPSFAREGNRVYVAVGEWVGCFPAVPEPAGASTVLRAASPVRVVASGFYVAQEGRAALADLAADERQAAGFLASYWDTEMGAHVPGVPPLSAYQTGKMRAWNQDPAILNHGDLPSDLLWSLCFPFPAGSQSDAEREQMGRAILNMLQSRLQADAYGVLALTPKQVVAQFHGNPPIALPGYVIRNHLYVPEA